MHRAAGLMAVAALAICVVVAPMAVAAGLDSGGLKGVVASVFSDGASASGNVYFDGTKLCLNALCTSYIWRSDVNTMQWVNGGAVHLQSSAADGIVRNPTTNPGFLSAAASGSNAFAASTAGARFDFGPGANDYASSDGTTVTFAGPVATGSLTTAGSGNITTGTNANFVAGTNGQFVGNVSTGTPASGTGITANYTSSIRHFVHKVTVTNAALTAAATTDITLHITPANTRIIRVLAEVTQVFSGGALSAVAVTCGNSAGGNQYLLSHSQLSATGAFGDVVAEMGAGVVSATLADMGTVATGVPGAITVQCRYSCTGANCNAATQGSTTYYVEGVTY